MSQVHPQLGGQSQPRNVKKSMRVQRARGISVKPADIDQFMRDVQEYKQILRSIGLYELSQNWKQNRDQQREVKREERLIAKNQLKVDKQSLGEVCYNMAQQQEQLFSFLDNPRPSQDESARGEQQEQKKQKQQLQQEQQKEKEYHEKYNSAYRSLAEQSVELEEQHLQSSKAIENENEVEDEALILTVLEKKLKLQSLTQQQQQLSFQKATQSLDESEDKSRVVRKVSSSGGGGSTNIKRVNTVVNSQLRKQAFRSQENSEVESGNEQTEKSKQLETNTKSQLLTNPSLQKKSGKHHLTRSEDDDESLINETDIEKQLITDIHDSPLDEEQVQEVVPKTKSKKQKKVKKNESNLKPEDGHDLKPQQQEEGSPDMSNEVEDIFSSRPITPTKTRSSKKRERKSSNRQDKNALETPIHHSASEFSNLILLDDSHLTSSAAPLLIQLDEDVLKPKKRKAKKNS